MKNQSDISQIKTAIKQFMGKRRVCWAKPGAERHSLNFYGDAHECRFTANDLAATIGMFHECLPCSWNPVTGVITRYSDNDCETVQTLEMSIDDVLSDMQLERPE